MKKIAIIGGGASGLAAIKCCVDEGLEPICFERTSEIGGLWNYRMDVCDSQGCVMRTTIINTSKEMMCFSDFPIPKEFSNFMHNTKVMEYFELYARHFDLKKHIRFKTEITRVQQSSDFAKSGKWDLHVCDLESKTEKVEVFDAVIVCTGHHSEKYMAQFEGEENFTGRRIHTHDIRNVDGFQNKRVVIIGIGNSAGDVAVDLSRCCDKVYLSTRSGSWVTNRIFDGGIPADMALIRRITYKIQSLLSRNIRNTLIEYKLNKRFDHALYGLKPKHRFDAQHVTVNDDLPNRIAAGTIVVKPNVRRITKTGVEFDDGTAVDDIDVIIYATGYIFGFPFIKHKAFEIKKNQLDFFKYVFPPDIHPSTIAVIGAIQPLGAIMPISELQCRLVTRVFKGDVLLPSADAMWEDVRKKKTMMASRYIQSQRHTIQVDYLLFMDELAELTGCTPDIRSLLFQDPKLALAMYFGPCTPYQYRVMGHGRWDGAREAILTTWDRMKYPLQTRPVEHSHYTATAKLFWVLFVVLVAFLMKLFL